MIIGFINGEYINVDEPVLPIEERGHQFGDGVYEVVRVYNSKPFLLDEHLERLEKSAASIRLTLPYTFNEMKDIILEGIQKSGLQDAEVYFQVTRGIAPRTHLFPKAPASFTMNVKPAREVPEGVYTNGADTITVKDERWANCHIKSLNLLPNILAKQTAADNGKFEAIMVADNVITEGSSTNVFVVKDGIIYTTPTSSNILSGITRKAIIDLAQQENVKIVEEEFTFKFLHESDEAFITSTTIEVVPVRSVNDQLIADGKPGPITKLLQAKYSQLYKEQLYSS